tara:strand:- start:1099 stop:1326 length:228 start_codon:yes stop_codon:yes gene_type:complete
MCFGRRSQPAPPPPPPAPVAPPAAPPTQASAPVKAARKAEKVAAANLQGRKSTILTGPRGDLSAANINKKTLLGA